VIRLGPPVVSERQARSSQFATAPGPSLRVTFPVPAADADYAVFVEQSWLCHRAISEKNAEGFTVTFDQPASGKASLDWMLVR
jgi:hypothetical protein